MSLEFDDLITTLTGPSDRGKSSVIRALRWLCLNRAPKQHINLKSEDASVKLVVDGHIIIRKQGPGKNLYILDGRKFRSFNKKVPDEIAAILNISELNFQRQLDPHFWISLPPPQLSKELNKLVDLEVIDRSISNINHKLRKTKIEVEISEDRLKKLRQEKKSLAWTIEADIQLREIERRNDLLIGTQSSAIKLRSLVSDMERVNASIKDDTKRLGRARSIVFATEKHMKTTQELEQLRLLVDNILECKRLASVKVPDISSLEDTVHNIKSLRSIIAQYEIIKEELWDAKREMKISSERLRKRMIMLKECPLCERPMTP